MHDQVQDYYGKVLQGSHDLKTNACCTPGAIPKAIRQALVNVHDNVLSRYYGCGLVAPQLLEGMRILDLGCGSGRDCYVLAQLTGENGSVVGVDMTPEQLEVARATEEWHRERFGYARKNTTFLHGYIERLDELNLPDASFDIIVSNCVINLSPDKEAVLREAWRLLKPGGELYFSDVYADRRVPESLRQDQELYGECLSGALYWNDFHTLAKACGFRDPRLVEDHPITIENEAVEQKIGHIRFFSATYRLFKIEGLEPACEDYGQAVIYKGSIPGHEEVFELDAHHRIERGRVFPVCGNTWRMLAETRFAPHFEFIGNWDTHYGMFKGCGTDLPFGSARDTLDARSGDCC